MYKNKQLYSIAERDSAADYLDSTPVAYFSQLRDKFKWFKVDIESPQDLPNLGTWWGELNGLKKNPIDPDEKFSLSEVANMIKDGTMPDKVVGEKVLEYKSLIETGELEIRLTLFEDGSRILIADGNKRALALLIDGKSTMLKVILIGS